MYVTINWSFRADYRLGRRSHSFMESNIALTPFSRTDVELLRHWLTAPHVAAWHPDPKDHIAWATNPPPSGNRALSAVGSRAVGYI
jgi:aminoglycoside 6'-N-acetyltransferase